MSEIACPRCRSEHNVSRRIAHQQGRASFYTAGMGTDSSGNIYTAQGGGISESNFSRQHRPPEKPVPVVWGTIMAIGAAIGLAFLIFIDHDAYLIFIFLGFLGYNGYHLNKDLNYQNSGQYDRDITEYNKSFVCLKCGNIFAVDL